MAGNQRWRANTQPPRLRNVRLPSAISHKPSTGFSHPPEYTVRRHGGGSMKRTRNVVFGRTLVTLLAALGVGQHLLQQSAEAQAKGSAQAARFEVDPMWPKPGPKHWVFGNSCGGGAEKNDHVYSTHGGAGSLEGREISAAATPPQSECCVPAPP